MVVEADPVSDRATGVLQGLESAPMHALFFERANDALDQAALLRTVRRDELLAKSVAPRQCRVTAAGEDQAVVRSEQKRLRHAPQGAEPSDQRLLASRLGGFRSAATR